MRARDIDLSERRFGSLVVIGPAGVRKEYRRWRTRCDCGKERIARGADRTYKHGITKCQSCARRRNSVTHGMSRHPAYTIWCAMKTRCARPTHHGWQNYGGRGITVCDRWQESFANFWEDMG